MPAIQGPGDVASALWIPTAATALSKNQQKSQVYEPRSRRYPAKVAVHDGQGDAVEERDGGNADVDYEQDEEVLYAGPS